LSTRLAVPVLGVGAHGAIVSLPPESQLCGH
jgi:hypothetical protein